MKIIQNPNDINAKFYDQIFSDEKEGALTTAECTLISSLAGEPPKHILDIGIGTGRHAKPLSKIGYTITGIDSSKGMLSVLKQQMISGIKIKLGNIFDINFDKESKFDLVILMWNTFNEIALTKLNAKKLINKLLRVLKPNGKILINIGNIETESDYKPEFELNKYIKGLGDIRVIWSNKSYNNKTRTTVSEEQIILDGKKLMPAYIKQRWWKASEIKDILDKQHKLDVIKLPQNNELYIVISSIR